MQVSQGRDHTSSRLFVFKGGRCLWNGPGGGGIERVQAPNCRVVWVAGVVTEGGEARLSRSNI